MAPIGPARLLADRAYREGMSEGKSREARATRRFGAITRTAPGLKPPLEPAGGVAALILTHGNRQAALWVRRNPIGIAG